MMRARQVSTWPVIWTVAASLALLLLTGFAHGETVAEAEARYGACMNKVETNAEAAFDDAVAWEGLGGGHPARHCALAALVEIGHYAEAAQGLEKLADEVRANVVFKAQLLIQSGHAWIAADKPVRAAAVADAALRLVPNTPQIFFLRAHALALQGKYWEAADDFSKVIYAEPDNIDALVMRGAAYRQLEARDLALKDLNRALAIDPDHVEGLLERGIVHRLDGRKTQARTDWQRLIARHPDTPAGQAAEQNLHGLNSGSE